MSAAACRQWAAVNTIRGASTMPVQKPEPSAPRVSTITTRSPNGAPSCAGPTIARAVGAPKRAKSANKAAEARFRPELMIPGLARPRRLAQDRVSADRLLYRGGRVHSQGCSTLSTEGHGEYCFEACESGGEAVLRN